MITFETLYNLVVPERKKKTLSTYDHYKTIRKTIPPTGTAFKDKSKYTRKAKYKKNYQE
jgi:hypothetical protein